jgi:ABC-type Fe3+/spermidine/putrescine transport system ATPase subunit
MFQDYALFPHLNVAENVAFGLSIQHTDHHHIQKKVKELLGKVALNGFEGRDVLSLSGGEQQRVALARSLAPAPQLLMLDEPMGALDRELKDALLIELRHILKETGIPVLYVTHDQEEAFTIADRLLLLNDGRIVQDDTPENIYAQPSTPWVADFLGFHNWLEGSVVQPEPLRVKTELGEFKPIPNRTMRFLPGENVRLLLRPEIEQPCSWSKTADGICGEVLESIFRGNHYEMKIRTLLESPFSFYVQEKPQIGASVVIPLSAVTSSCYKTQ